jgi:hypothetical protein
MAGARCIHFFFFLAEAVFVRYKPLAQACTLESRHAGQPNRNKVTTAAGIAIEASAKMQRCFVRGLHSAAQHLILHRRKYVVGQ